MIREFLRAALDGIQLDELDSRIYIEDIRESVKLSTETIKRPRYGQQLIAVPGHDSLDVVIQLMIKARRPDERMDVMEKIMGWATSGYLTVSTRPGLRIFATCTQPPQLTAFHWTDRLTIGFTAYGESCWEQADVVSVTASAQTDWTGTIRPAGTRPCYLEAAITNTTASPLTELTLTARTVDTTISESVYTMTLTGMALGENETVRIFYDQYHFFYIGTGLNWRTSLLPCRTAASVDDMLLIPKVDNQLTFSADAACDLTLWARGLWR